MVEQREIYRTKDGRFSSRRLLWQGPVQPFQVIWRKAMDEAKDKIIEAFSAPNTLLQVMRSRNRGG